MQTLFQSNNTFFMTKILDNRHFLFTYNRNGIKTDEEDFFELKQTIHDFFYNKIVAIKT